MKRSRFFIACLVFPFMVEGQCPSNKTQLEVSGGYGIVTEGQVFNNSYTDPSGVAVTQTKRYYSSAEFISLRYFFYNRLAFGFTGGISGDRSSYAETSFPLVTGTSKQQTVSVAFEMYYIYTFRKFFELYTFFGVGQSFSSRTTTGDTSSTAQGNTLTTSVSRLDFQYSPVAIRVGGRFGGFMELGVGYKGVVNCGLSYKIGRSGTPWWKD